MQSHVNVKWIAENFADYLFSPQYLA